MFVFRRIDLGQRDVGRIGFLPLRKNTEFFLSNYEEIVVSDFILVDLLRGSASFGLELVSFHTSVIDAPIARSSNTFVFLHHLSSAFFLSDPKAHEAHHSWVVGAQENPQAQKIRMEPLAQKHERHPIE